MSTGIEWTEETWNPIRASYRTEDEVGEVLRTGWHCERVSPGCQHCYAETQNMARRFDLGTGLGYTRPNRDLVRIEIDEASLEKPLHWRKPRRVFVCSMTDLFGEWVTDEMLAKVWGMMSVTPHITYQILTKRPERMREWVMMLDAPCRANVEAIRRDVPGYDWPLPNVWLVASVEDQQRADERIPILLETPAAVRGLSCEPLLGPVDLAPWVGCEICGKALPCDCGFHKEPALDWVIVGGESGPGARPCDLAWVRSIVAQCKAAGVAVFVKQLGSRPIEAVKVPSHRVYPSGRAAMDYRDEPSPLKLRDRKGGDPAEWPEALRVREWPR